MDCTCYDITAEGACPVHDGLQEGGERPKISWHDVPLYRLDDGKEIVDDADRERAFLEFRQTGGIAGIVMADPGLYDREGRHLTIPDVRIEQAGPEVDEIDWSDFPGFCVATSRGMPVKYLMDGDDVRADRDRITLNVKRAQRFTRERAEQIARQYHWYVTSHDGSPP